MARSALEWMAQALADRAAVGVTTISRFESGQTSPNPATLAALQRALEAGSVEFIPKNDGSAGMRLRKGDLA